MTTTNNLFGTIATIGLLLAIIGSGWMILEVGFGQSIDVLTDDTTNMTADTVASFGGSVDFLDRASVFAAYITIAVSLGIISVQTAGRDDKLQETVNTVVQYYPLVGLAIGFLGFWDITMDFVTGDYDFSAHVDGVNAHMMAVAGWVVYSVAQLVTNRGSLN